MAKECLKENTSHYTTCNNNPGSPTTMFNRVGLRTTIFLYLRVYHQQKGTTRFFLWMVVDFQGLYTYTSWPHSSLPHSVLRSYGQPWSTKARWQRSKAYDKRQIFLRNKMEQTRPPNKQVTWRLLTRFSMDFVRFQIVSMMAIML